MPKNMLFLEQKSRNARYLLLDPSWLLEAGGPCIQALLTRRILLFIVIKLPIFYNQKIQFWSAKIFILF